MKHVTINGVPLTVVTAAERDEFGIQDPIPLGRGGGYFLADDALFIASRLTRRDLLVATGHDEGKVDYAVPQAWWEAHGRPRAFWSYEGNSTFGFPLYEDRLITELCRRVLRALVEEE